VKFHVLAVGHRMPGWVAAGVQEYVRRMPSEMPIVLREIRPETRPAGEPGPALRRRLLAAEAERVRAARPPNSVLIVLDERGQSYSTRRLADAVQAWRQEGRDPAFVIGGADGLDEQLKQSAQLMLSLSAMTLPHQLVRVLLVEQIYRAVSILSNHPYHRA
jgi:23S rRNA (pseudouridine1915-N3)-methyltransferase